MNSINRNNIKQMSVAVNSTIREAMQAIWKGTLGSAFVVNDYDGSFVQVLTDGDLRKAILKGHGLESGIDVIEKPESTVATEDMTLQEINNLFSESIRIIPVLNKNKQIIDVHYLDKRKHIAVTETFFDEKELEYVSECILSGWVSSSGPFIKKFEDKMANFCGTKYAISCSSATTALHLSLLANEIGVGDEVIIPSLSFIATANAVSYTGAKPVFVDSDPETWNIDPKLIKDAITPQTKAIMPVHLYGQPADMDPIQKIADEYQLCVIEDAAEAHGAIYRGRRVGSLGDAGIFSFFGNKIITTGEGGMIVTNNEEISEKCRILRDHGMSRERRYWHTVLGYNYRMTNLQAALGVAQMEKIESIISRKREVARKYTKHLRDVSGITLPTSIPWAENVFWLFTILIDEQVFGNTAENVINEFRKEGIDTRPVFHPIHKQPIYSTGQSLPVSERLSASGISLPSAPNIRDDMILKVCKMIRKLSCK